MTPVSPAPVSLARLTLILGSLTAFTPLAVDMYLPALPGLAREFAAPDGRIELTLSAFFVGLALGQLVTGPLSDRFGRLKPLFGASVIFVLASIACAFATSAEMLIALRFVQALGCCGGLVIGRAMVRDLYPPQEMARVFSLLMLVLGVAPILAPLLGGYMLIWFGWPAIFGFLAVVGSIVLLAAWRLLPESHPGPYRPLSLLGSLKDYAGFFADRRFMGYTLASALPSGGMFAYIAGSPFVFIELHGMAPHHYAWVFGGGAFGLIGASQLNRVLLRRFTSAEVLAVAGGFAALASLGLLLVAWAELPLPFLIAAVIICLAPMGMVMPNAGAAAMAAVQGPRAGTAAALMGILQFGCGGASSALVGTLHTGTAVPMAGLIAFLMVSGFVVRSVLVRD
ncbi:multidrug effflux MFS transporter [Ferrovibrio sp.]|uniref:multidrug effflux MFS transporter n=1 Tax=Ferrovibrio sp. TaxID=1917215 RepID=UPI001B7C09C9|nr:multidrug effflux MFS transporter [Ferrovibrio sp.]MBP7064906.1 multidrug effflux MFS transporter [Ferrovibrio sp.]